MATINPAIYDKNIFAASKDAIFEDVHIKIPLDYDALLMRIYGEYMKLPPKEKQVAHHGYVAIDTDKPFTEYISKMRG